MIVRTIVGAAYHHDEEVLPIALKKFRLLIGGFNVSLLFSIQAFRSIGSFLMQIA